MSHPLQYRYKPPARKNGITMKNELTYRPENKLIVLYKILKNSSYPESTT